jgi:hypothetical protein
MRHVQLGGRDQPSGSDQIDHFRSLISWLIEANLPLPDEKWLKAQAWIWSNPEGSRLQGNKWCDMFNFVVGIIHTNYFNYAVNDHQVPPPSPTVLSTAVD